jgi:hypothetical protein
VTNAEHAGQRPCHSPRSARSGTTTGLPGVRVARTTWSVEPVGSTQAILRSDAQVEHRGTVFDRALRGVMRCQSRRAAARSLGAFKHIVETGTPPARGDRYPAPTGC